MKHWRNWLRIGLMSTSLLFTTLFVVSAQVVQDRVGSIKYSPDGRWIAVSGGRAGCAETPSPDFGVRIFDAQTGQLATTLLGMTCTSTSVDWSPDGRYLASVNVAQGEIHIWDVPTEQLEQQIPARVQGVTGIRWSPNGLWIGASAYGDFTILIDTIIGSRGDSFDGGIFAWGPSGFEAVVASQVGRYLLIQQIDSANQVQDIMVFDSTIFAGGNYDLDWSLIGNRIAQITAENIVRIANPGTGELVQQINVPNLTDGKLSPDGTRLATVSLDGRIDIWRVEDGSLERSITGLTDVYTVAWNPAGTDIAYFDSASVSVQIEQVFIPPTSTPPPTATPTSIPPSLQLPRQLPHPSSAFASQRCAAPARTATACGGCATPTRATSS